MWQANLTGSRPDRGGINSVNLWPNSVERRYFEFCKVFFAAKQILTLTFVRKERNIVGLKGSAKKRAHFCTGTDKSTFVFTPGVTPTHPSAAAAPTHPLTDRGDPWRPCSATDRADPRQRRGAGQPAASESPVRLQAGRPNHCHRRPPSANKSE